MKKFNSKVFFIKSAFVHVIISLFIALVSVVFFEDLAYNTMHKLFAARGTASDDIVILVIDDKSVEQYRWPWQRDLYAKMFAYLSDYAKPKIIGYDALITNLDLNNPASDRVFFNQVSKMDNLVVAFNPMVQKFPSDVDGNKYSKDFENKFKINVNDERTGYKSEPYHSLSRYPKPYFDAVKYNGSVQTPKNSYGYVTNINQLISYNGVLYPSLGLRMYLKLHNTDKVTVKDDKIIIDETGLEIPSRNAIEGVISKLRYYNKPIDSDYTHKCYSAVDIIKSYDNLKQGKPPIIAPEVFKDKIVYVGGNAKASALGLEDALPTPIQSKHPGVDIQATNLDNILNGYFMQPVKFSQNAIIVIILTVIVFVLIAKLSFFVSLFSLLLLMVGYIVFAGLCFANGYSVGVVTPLAIQLFTMIFAYSYRFILEGRNKEKIKQAMGKYISQDIMQNVVSNIDDIKLGGKKAVVTVLFSDIRGFTRISEQLNAEEVSVILNEYFTEIEPIITKYNGVINKFIGDAVMAIFGEPIQDINHAKNAVLCANEMLKAVDKLRDKWLFEGKPRIEIGIGINTGEAFVGNIGSEKRMEYTVIGDMVNVASRIESYNKVYKTNFLISSSTYKHVSDIADVIKISEVQIRGKSKKMDIYEVLRLS